MSEATITLRDLDVIADAHRRGAMLFDSEEHDLFVELAITWIPTLVRIARDVVPGKVLLEVRIPGLVPRGTLNSREHWATRRRRVAKEHSQVGLALALWARANPKIAPPPWRVTLIRCVETAGRFLDDDNAVGAMKGARDAVANWIGRDDGDDCFEWRVEQRKVPRKDVGTVVRVEERR